jgi:hypothetical protein
MATMTLLEMTQSVLNAMDSDDVNSIDDTVESVQVALIIKESYFDLISQRNWPFLGTKFSMTGLADVTRRTYLQLLDTYSKIDWVKYNGVEVDYLDPKDFQDMLDQRVVTANVVDSNKFVINRDPMYFTTFDDELFIFDAIDLSVDTTLQTSKNTCFGTRVPTWTHDDAFIPDMPAKMFPTLLSESKSTAFINLKQQANANEARKAQRGRNIMQNEAWRNSSGQAKWNTRVNYGRK